MHRKSKGETLKLDATALKPSPDVLPLSKPNWIIGDRSEISSLDLLLVSQKQTHINASKLPKP